MGRPAIGCSAFGRALRMRVPRPAARMMAAAGMASPVVAGGWRGQAPVRSRWIAGYDRGKASTRPGLLIHCIATGVGPDCGRRDCRPGWAMPPIAVFDLDGTLVDSAPD